MKQQWGRAWRVMLITMMLGGLSGVARTQNQSGGFPQNPGPPIHDPLSPLGPPTSPSMAAKQEKARNDERQKRLVSDTEKLLALATQLNEEVGKTDKNVLSVEVIKKAEEIEKLAHAVKERERG